jgi:hypothetical protein
MNLENFKKVTIQVIDNLEGGYFHPNMRTANPTKFGTYHRSGETMYGLDRFAGHDLYYKTPRKASTVLADLPYIESGVYEYKNDASREFWTTLDNINAKNVWKWNFKGGELAPRLKDLASLIIYGQFIYLFNKYLSAKAKLIVESNDKLMFHFIYATWNGSGWFQKFATIFNKEVEKTNDVNKLITVALNSRINSGNDLIKQGGLKIKKLFDTNFNTTTAQPTNTKPKIIGLLLIVSFLGYLYVKNKF